MGNKKGQRHYPPSIKELIREEYSNGVSQRELSRKYGVSRYTIQAWCGLRGEVNIRQIAPLKKRTSNQQTRRFREKGKTS